MVVVRKEHTRSNQQSDQQFKHKGKKKQKRSYRFEKIIITVILFSVLSSSIALLLRFVTITEIKHRVHRLEKDLERLEVEREKLKIEVEKVSKSGWIEKEAKERLNMQYPLSNQTVYINVDPTKVALINNELKELGNEETTRNSQLGQRFFNLLSRVMAFLQI